mmetsp:Transcript_969/g.1211  ORF Transcript_969/g.1211 Transcript_969/m.1211 type:complete len:480 (+) Transcript_969:111-1550(+)
MARVNRDAEENSSTGSPAPPPPPGEPPANARRLTVPDGLVKAAAAKKLNGLPGLTGATGQNAASGSNLLGRKRPASWGSRDISEFQKLETIGQGTYGHVYKASDKTTGEIVALKKIKMDNEKEGFPITAIREIKILKSLRHENIVELKEIVTSKGQDQKTLKNVYMVFEYLDHDLAGLLDSPEVTMSETHTKCYMKQLLNGVHYMHRNKILHRDIKGSNLLINNDGYLKIADWGLARSWYEHQTRYTVKVITLWYRPPELLMGCQKYGPAIDMWSVGCIFAELLFKQPILKGVNDMDQLQKIFNLCGDPTEETWPKMKTECPNWHMFQPKPGEPARPRRLRQRFQSFSRLALDLVDKLLTLDPKQRIDAKEALDHEYFWQEPLPCDPEQLPKFNIQSAHEWDARKRREQEKQDKEKKAAEQYQRQQQQQRGGTTRPEDRPPYNDRDRDNRRASAGNQGQGGPRRERENRHSYGGNIRNR